MTMPPGFRLEAERPDDAAAIDALLDLAFGVARHAKRSYAYRRDVDSVPALRVVARDPGGRLVGTLRFWPIAIESDDGAVRRPALLLGPIAVEPHLKGQGVGRALMAEGLARAASLGHDLVLLVGDLAYYGQFGFVPAAPLGFVMPGEQPHRLLCRILGAGSASGPTPGILVPAPAPTVR
jgi:predicted N-acetyltransferase YhbS